MKHAFLSRRHRDPHQHEDPQKEQPFFSKETERRPFFNRSSQHQPIQAKLAIGQPGDKYEREADAVANRVVNGKKSQSPVQGRGISGIQRLDLATPIEDEKLSTAESRMEKDKLIQEKSASPTPAGSPDMMEDKKKKPVQMQSAGMPAMDEKKKKPVQMQSSSPDMMEDKKKKPVQMQSAGMPAMDEKKKKPVQMQSGSPDMKEDKKKKPVQMQSAGIPAMDEKKKKPVQMQSASPDMKEDKKKKLQTKASPNSSGRSQEAQSGPETTSPQLANRIQDSSGKGQPMPDKTRLEMEAAMGSSFRGVNIHTDARAAELNQELGAHAFTHGRDVYFNSGKYSPDTAEGKKLLAHELTHVVQQQGGMVSRDRDESSASQAGVNEEQVGCESEDRISEIRERYQQMIAAARGRGANVAADNLEYFLAGSGGVRVLSTAWLRGFSEVTDAEKKNEERFVTSLNRIANGMTHGDHRSHADHWDAMLTGSALSELYYASGTSTIRSTGNFTLEMIEDVVNISGHVTHHWFDPYDWHAGLGAYIPGFGSISDSDGLLMQSCAGAKPFQMEANWDRSLSGNVVVGRLWNNKNLTWSGP